MLGDPVVVIFDAARRAEVTWDGMRLWAWCDWPAKTIRVSLVPFSQPQGYYVIPPDYPDYAR